MEFIDIELALYAEIDYVDENAKRYETINVCSYSSNFEIRFYDKYPQTDTKST